MLNPSRIIAKVALPLLVALVGLCGCAHQYIMTLSNGDQIVSASKPKLQGKNYYYTDGPGARYAIPQSRVVNIRGASLVEEEEKPAASPSPPKPKQPKHWYFLWLA